MTKFINCSEEAKETKKETMFTHQLNASGFSKVYVDLKSFEKIIYLGKCSLDGDMFACYEDNYIDIYKGIKGDEFD